MNTIELINLYKIYIYDRYIILKNSGKEIFDNFELSKIFEYYVCIKLMEEYKIAYYEYNDIDLEFKELNKLTQQDTGIDCCNLIDTIVQCKLRKKSLNWGECGTFFGLQNIRDKNTNKTIIKWNELIIARNECKLSQVLNNMLDQERFIDKIYNRSEMIKFCEQLLINKPIYPIICKNFELRYYQVECIDMIINQKRNLIISLPTGTGKAAIITYSLQLNAKYLILVPRIVLMDQMFNEIMRMRPEFKNQLQRIGKDYGKFNENKNITICVYNSFNIVNDYKYDKIFIDEAHHIYNPSIYTDNQIEVRLDNDGNADEDKSKKYLLLSMLKF